MKTILLLIVSMLFICGCSREENQYKNDWTRNKLKGKVKSIKEIGYFVDDKSGEIKRGNKIYSILDIYNEKGNIIESYEYVSDSIFFKKTTLKYDDNGNIIEQNIFRPIDSLNWKHTYKHNYDGKGNKIESCEYFTDGSLRSRDTYKYDDRGNNIEWDEYSSSDSLIRKYTYKFDERGLIIETNEYNSSNSLISKDTYKYDDRGNTIEWNKYNSNDSLISKDTYKHNYDDKGNKIESCYYKTDGSLSSKTIFRYDDKENLINEIYLDSFDKRIIDREIKYF